MRYVERNPLRAGLVDRAEDWPRSSLHKPNADVPLNPGPVPRRPRWRQFVNKPMTDAEADAVRLSITGDRPFGSERWIKSTAARLGLGGIAVHSAVHSQGRPFQIR